MNLKRRDFIKKFSCACCAPLFLSSCAEVAITNRRQLSFVSEKSINKQAKQAYESIKQTENIVKTGSKAEMLHEVGKKVTTSVENYFNQMGQFETLKDYEWEYILIEEPETLNAWCMPGGKIAFYSGILEVTKDENGLAAVMGHEIAHAVARHSLERASAALAINVGTLAADIALGGAISRTRNTVGQTTGMDIVQLGIFNPFSRYQESEADYLGVIFANLSGYDPSGAIQLWERMQEKMKGKEPPQFLSTHPSSGNRINDLRLLIPKVKIEYPKIQNL